MLNIVILAAGKGTRMHSDKPKVLHALASTPLLQHVINTAVDLGPTQICVVYGHGGEAVVDGRDGLSVEDHEPLDRGIGQAAHAVRLEFGPPLLAPVEGDADEGEDDDQRADEGDEAGEEAARNRPRRNRHRRDG